MVPYKSDGELPGMLNDPSREIDKGEADGLHPFGDPGCAESKLFHGHVQVEGKDRDLPPCSILSEASRRELPSCQVFLEDGMGLFRFAAAFIGKSDKPVPSPVHVGDKAVELVLGFPLFEDRERKIHTGQDRLTEDFPDREVAVGRSFL